MRRTATVPIVLLLALTLVGCLESRDAIVLKKDGTGTITSQYTVDLGKLRELVQMYEMMQGGDPEAAAKISEDDLPNPAAPAWFEAAAEDAKGYAIQKAVQETTDGKRTTQISATFTSIEAAAKGGAFFASTVTLSAVEKSEEVPTGAWKLVIKNALSGGDPDAMGGMDLATAMTMVEAQLSSLSIQLNFTAPTKILEHNGTKSEQGNVVSWTVDYDKILEGKDVTMAITFAASEELGLKPFTHAPDMRILARRAMSKPPAPKKDEGKGTKDGEAKQPREAKEAKKVPAEEAKPTK